MGISDKKFSKGYNATINKISDNEYELIVKMNDGRIKERCTGTKKEIEKLFKERYEREKIR